jgi:hypothetical protein
MKKTCASDEPATGRAGNINRKIPPSEEFPPTHQREFAMSISVTENASAVTDVMALLSGLGYDSRRRDSGMTLVIDKYDQWANPTNGMLTGSCLPSRFDV